jgi:hypothetical protein
MPIFVAPFRKLAPWMFVAVLSLGLQIRGYADTASASLTLEITDTSGFVIQDAEVAVRDTSTNQEQRAHSGKSGITTFPFLKPGRYALVVSKQSFSEVSVDNIILNVGDQKSLQLVLKVGSAAQSVTVDDTGLTLNTTDASVSTIIDRSFVANMPLNGRSFQDLISMTPGVVTQSPQNSNQGIGYLGDFSVNGQRTESNYYTVDGVSGNTSAGSGNGYAQSATGGTIGGSTALGTTQSLISVDALQEFTVQGSSYSAEYGRSPGGQFSLVTRSGTNRAHGSAFDYLRNNFFDANDWFNDYYIKPASALRQNDFGGTFGGPVWLPRLYDGKDRTFFFASYEGLRLTQPTAATIQYVPDMFMRQQAVPAMQEILNAFPIQNGIDYGSPAAPNLAQFIASVSAPGDIDATSIRMDHRISPKLSVLFRYGNTSSSIASRPDFLVQQNRSNVQTYTVGATALISSGLTDDFRLGYDRSSASQESYLDGFGGATPIDLTGAMGMGSFATPDANILFYFPGLGISQMAGGTTIQSLSRQWNVVDTFSASVGHHQFKGGLDYREIKSPLRPYDALAIGEFLSAKAILNGTPEDPFAYNYFNATPIFHETALFLQDEWRIRHSLSLSLGLRWEVNPPPTEEHGNDAYTVLGNVSDPLSLTLAPRGTPLYKTAWFNFAPRLGMAWTAGSRPGRETVVRAGGGVFFDTPNEIATLGYSGFGFGVSRFLAGAEIPFTTSQLTVPFSTTPPYTSNAIYAFPSHLQLPYTLQWNTSMQQALGKTQAITISYVGANGRRLLQRQYLYLTPYNPDFSYIYYFPAGITSNYQALQFQFQHSVAQGIHALASYTWSHSIDFGSTASAYPSVRGNSDFDVRNNFQGGLSWDLPSTNKNEIAASVFDNWGVDGRLNVRSSFPVPLVGNLITDSSGLEYYAGLNLVSGQPLYIYGTQYPGGRSINKAAFLVPAAGSTGNAPRNFVRGFGATQLNLAARREFPLYESVAIQFRAEAFNILNHPNFGYIDPAYTDATFGQATKMLNSSLGTMASQYQQGGARSMQFALKLTF